MTASSPLLRREGVTGDGRSFLVRPSRDQDAAALSALRDSVAAEGEHIAEAPGEQGILELSSGIDAVLRNGGLALTLEVQGKVTGHLMVQRRSGRAYAHVGEIAIIIHNSQRGSGFGRTMMEMAIEWSRAVGMAKLALRVFASNSRAIGLYRSLGFADEGVVRAEVRMPGGDRDLVLMGMLL